MNKIEKLLFLYIILVCATTSAFAILAKEASTDVEMGDPVTLSTNCMQNLQNLMCSVRLSWRTGSFINTKS